MLIPFSSIKKKENHKNKIIVKIELNLLDNGLDFILEGIKPTNRLWNRDNTESTWKYSVLNVFSGIQLILKDRLRQEHWSLIFEDVSKANELKLNQGDFVSVNHGNIIKRLSGICNIQINDTPINELRKLRNKFEHFEVKIEVNKCKQAIANAIRELIILWDKDISKYSSKEQNNKFDLIKTLAFEFETYAQNMLQKHKNKMKGILDSNSGILIHCKSCSNHSFMVYGNESKNFECFVCEEKIKKEEFLKKIRDDEKERSQNEISFIKYEPYDYNCENCQKQTRIRYKPSYFLATDEYKSDYFFCVECLHNETQSDINSREFKKELRELEKNHTHEEFIEILKSRIIEIEEEE